MPLHPHHWLDYRHWLNWTWWDLRLFDLNWCGAQGLHWGHHSLLRDQFVGRYRAMVDHLLRRLEIGAHRCGWKHSHGSHVCTKTGSSKLQFWARLTSLSRNFADEQCKEGFSKIPKKKSSPIRFIVHNIAAFHEFFQGLTNLDTDKLSNGQLACIIWTSWNTIQWNWIKLTSHDFCCKKVQVLRLGKTSSLYLDIPSGSFKRMFKKALSSPKRRVLPRLNI